MNSSFYNGLSGIKNNQYGIDTIAENIANIDTIGYKKSNSPSFSTIFSTTLTDSYFSPTSNDMGIGVKITAPTLNMSQGILQTTDKTFDLALSGEGWFGVQSSNNNTYYTRAGTFGKDANGDLVDSNGDYLLTTSGGNITPTVLPKNVLDSFGKYYGKSTSTLGTPFAISSSNTIPLGLVGSQTKINLPDILYYPPDPTTKVSYQANLDPTIIKNAQGIEVPNVEHFTSNIISTSGNKDVLDMTYTKQVPQPSVGSTWDGKLQILSFYENYNPSTTYDPTLYSVDRTAGKVYKIVDLKSGVIKFAGDGSLLSANLPTLSNSGTPLNINVGTPNSFTGFVSSTALDKARSEQHDGLSSGLLKDYGMDENGDVIANFNNGKTVPIAKVAVYHFQNDAGLTKMDSTLFQESANSGNPIFYTDASGNTILGSKIQSQSLESSNVDLSVAMSELILMQKSYDASAKSITTSDQMVQNAINMKK